MSAPSTLAIIMKHVWSDPKHRALIDYMYDYPSPIQQILGQVPREEQGAFVRGEGWANPDRIVSFAEVEPMPDFDWWEPRHDQPWRRQAARDRELDRLLG